MDSNPTLVLFVGGRPEIAATLKAVLAEVMRDCVFLAAEDGLEGLALAVSDDPEVVLLDADIPDMDPFTLCRRLGGHDISRTIPVLFLTDRDTEKEWRMMALEAGAAGFLPMPLDGAGLIAQLRAMVRLRMADRVRSLEVGQLAALVDKRSAKLRKELIERNQAERALRESEARYRALIETQRDAVCRWTPDATLTFANRAYMEIFGLEEKEIGRRRWTDFVPEDGRGQVMDFYRGYLRNPEEPHFEYEHGVVCADGADRWYHWVDTPVLDAGGHCVEVQSIGRDITAQHLAEEARKKSEARFQYLLESAPDAVFVQTEGCFAYANRAALRLFGAADVGALLGSSVLERFHPDDRKKVAERIRLLNEERAPVPRMVETSLRLDGTPVPVEVSAVPVEYGEKNGALVFLQDITERLAAGEALRESEARFRDLFMHHAAVKLIVDPDSGQIVDANEAAVDFYGYPRALLTAMRIQEINTLTEEEVRREMARAQALENVYFAFRHRLADGSIRDVDVYSNNVRVDERNLLYSVIVDVTERRRAETALRESEDRLRDITDSIADWIWEVDAGGLFIYSSEGCRAVLGYAVGEVLGRSPFDFMEPDEAKRVAAFFAGCVARKEPIKDLVNWYVAADGGRVCLLSNGVPKLDDGGNLRAYRGVCKNITRQKEAERERELLQAAIEQSGEAFIVTDAAGTIQYVNPVFEKLTGYTAAEAIGWTPRILKSGRQDEAFYRNLWGAISSGNTWRGRIVNRRKDGSFFTEETAISPIFDEQGRIVHYVATKHDITAQLLLEEQYSHSQKMESVGRLAGGMAHDFNNMLGVILGYSEIAALRLDPASPVQEELQEIRNAAERSARLTRQLLAFARLQSATPRLLDLNEDIGGMLKMLRPLIGENVVLEWRPNPDLWRVMMDPGQVDQIMANLCVNARDAMEGGGRITIGTENMTVDETRRLHHPVLKAGEYAVLNVSDDGCGMDCDTVSRIFEPFFTTKAVGEGTGLGLATVYGIVHQNGGGIEVLSEPGLGTTFSIFLPRSVADMDVDAVADIRDLPMGCGETVLLVEDEAAILRMTRDLLTQLNYNVLAAGGAEEAMALAEGHPGKIDLLLTDVVMPNMNGRELAEHLLSKKPEMSCVYMSGYTADVIASHGVVEASVLFIQKPFPMNALAKAVRGALDVG